VITCVLWLNSDRQNQTNNKSENFRTWLSENGVGIGDTLSVLGGLEEFQNKM
jgi:hypothetical protein